MFVHALEASIRIDRERVYLAALAYRTAISGDDRMLETIRPADLVGDERPALLPQPNGEALMMKIGKLKRKGARGSG